MASIKPTTIPSKRLSASITGSDTTFKLNNILGWDGAALTSASFGSVAYGVFRDSAGTVMELFQFDPTTIASASITIVARGLNFNGDYTTPVTANKLSWVKGDTIVELGSHVPQLLAHYVDVLADQTIAGVKTFSSTPASTGGNPVNTTDLTIKSYVDGLVLGTLTTLDVVVPGTADTTITAGQIVYLKTANGRWALASAATAATAENVLLGIAQGAGTAGNAISGGILLQGADANQSGLVAGNIQYLSDTPGAMSTTTGTKTVVLGIAKDATHVDFVPRFDQELTQDQINALAGTSGTAPSASNKFVDNSDTATTGANKVLRLNGSGALDPSLLPTSLVSTSLLAGEALTAGNAVAAGWYQADGGVKFDAKTGATGTAANIGSPTITVGNNANRIVIVLISTASQTIGTPTVGGVACTQIDAGASGTGNFYVGYVLAPATGSNTLACTFGGSTAYAWVAYSYYNVKQTGTIDSHAYSSAGGASGSQVLTPVLAGTLLFAYYTAMANASTTVPTLAGFPNNALSENGTTAVCAGGDNSYDPTITAQTVSYSGQSGANGNPNIGGFTLAPATAPSYIYAVQASANAAASYATPLGSAVRLNFIGFVTNSPSATQAATIQVEGIITSLSGLIPLKVYYLSNTLGAISTTAGANSRKVGIALSTTTLLITNEP